MLENFLGFKNPIRRQPESGTVEPTRWLVWALFFVLFLRFVCIWADTFLGAALPKIGASGFTVIFAAFAILHAMDVLGWPRALAFLLLCMGISWGFEAVGVATGLVYGNYHYGNTFGAKIEGVPFIIPIAWFMMVYASWVVAHILMEGVSTPRSALGAVTRALVAALVMTAWDAVMDPGMALSGAWTWEKGGSYFGVPFQNFAGWIATTLVVYLAVASVFRIVKQRSIRSRTRLYTGLPVLAYSLVATNHLLVEVIPELHIVAAFSVFFIALLTTMRLVCVRGAIALPG